MRFGIIRVVGVGVRRGVRSRLCILRCCLMLLGMVMRMGMGTGMDMGMDMGRMEELDTGGVVVAVDMATGWISCIRR